MKKLLVSVFIFIISLCVSYGAAYAMSPSDEDVNISLVSVVGVFEEEGTPSVRVVFNFDFKDVPILSKDHTIKVEWGPDWKLESYNVKENGIYPKKEVKIPPYDYRTEKNFKINPDTHLKDEKGSGYVVLTPMNQEVLKNQSYSAAHVDYVHNGLVKDFKLGDSISWENESLIGGEPVE